ncbi:MAG TPA: serine hydrolase domain-containing protein [Xanthobacteraceae bacterium]|nr:serine hydrolase domain-containing protein [Xanthobacteraceae bacterium]
MKKFSLVFAFLFLLAGLARAETLAPAAPEDVGFSSERLGRITQFLREESDKGAISGAVILVAREGKIAYFEALGARDPGSNAPMTKDAIFRIYSMSKPITSVAAMMLVEEGKLLLSDPVAKYLPEFKDVKVGVETPAGEHGPAGLDLQPARRAMTVQDLMRHTSGLTYGVFGDNLVKKAYRDARLYDGDFDNAAFSERVAKLPLMFQPGTSWEYSHATEILGRIVEVISGKSLYQFEKERILDPLGMVDTSFYVTDSAKHGRIAEPLADDRMIGPGAPLFDPRVPRKWEAGGQGMVGTAIDYARFLQMLLDGGALEGTRYLGPKTIAYMTSDHVGLINRGNAYAPGPGYGFGLGFAVRSQPGVAAVPGTPGDYAWSGAAGTTFWVDPKEKMFAILMLQVVKQRGYYRSVFRDMVYAAMTR